MQTIGLNALQINPDALGQALDQGDSLLITRRGRPIGVVAAFDDTLLDLGLRKWLAIRAFQTGNLSLGQVARIFEKPRDATPRCRCWLILGYRSPTTISRRIWTPWSD